MKVLIFGPSGSGKTYVSQALKRQGINAYDDGDIKGLSAWYNKQGNKVIAPKTAGEALKNHYSFLWSKRVLKKFLDKFSEVYIFGGSGNIFNVTDLFDRTFFLKVEPHIQKERILHSSRKTPLMDFDESGIVIWGDWIEQEARKRNIPFIDATLSPGQIFEIITRD
jgi:dephospho-CoA kinase